MYNADFLSLDFSKVHFISGYCIGSGYTERLLIIRFSAVFILSGIHKRYGPFLGNIAVVKQWNKVFGKRLNGSVEF